MAASYKFTLKRNNGTDYDTLYPATVVAQVSGLQTALDGKVDESREGVANGIATLDSNSKIPFSQLPSSVTGGMKFVGSVAGGPPAIDLSALGFTPSAETIGNYVIVNTSGTLTTHTEDGLVPNKIFHIANAYESDEGNLTASITVEAGDWIVQTGYTINAGVSITTTYAVVNNTYNDATTGVKGIVSLSDHTSTASMLGSPVITEGVLAAVLTADATDLYNGGTPIAGKIAPSSHTHSQYQPIDADLTAIAGLAVTDGNVIVGNGSAWVAESGATARASLGLTIGTHVQAYDAGLASIAGLTTAADQMIYTTAADTYAAISLTSAGRALLDDTDAAAQRTTLGLAIGTNVQAYDLQLTDIAGMTPTDSGVIVGNGTTFVLETGDTLRASLGLAIGTNVQAYDADLSTIAGLASTDGNFIVGSATGWVVENGSTARTSLGLAIGTDVQAYNAFLGTLAGLSKTDGNFVVTDGTTFVAESGATARTSLGVYSSTEVNTLLTNRWEFFYNTTVGSTVGDIIFDSVIAV